MSPPSNGSSARKFRASSWRILITNTPPCSKKANPANPKVTSAKSKASGSAADIILDRCDDDDVNPAVNLRQQRAWHCPSRRENYFVECQWVARRVAQKFSSVPGQRKTRHPLFAGNQVLAGRHRTNLAQTLCDLLECREKEGLRRHGDPEPHGAAGRFVRHRLRGA